MNIAVIILAAGNSSRMGRVKQLLPYKGLTLLEFAIQQALQSKAQKVYCVLGANAEIIKQKVKNQKVVFINNPNWEKGLSSSIITAITHLAQLKEWPEAFLVMLADQPYVNSAYLNNLMALYYRNKNKIIASAYGNINGVPAIFSANYSKTLLKLKGDKGAKALLNKNPMAVLRFVSNSNKTLMDIDSPEEYENLIKKDV